jgi:dTDP-4-amino-4,6-dideoxygalactose transaminase
MNSAMNTPILTANPKANYLAHKEEIDQAVLRVLESGWYILGSEVQAFESAFSSWAAAAHAVAVANGTDALEISLRACGVGPGDLVLTVSNTAVATVAAIERSGAAPVFVDIDPATFTMNPVSLEETLTVLQRDTGKAGNCQPKAVIPVHLYGHPADLPAILDIASRYHLHVIEDCAQAHGACLNDQKVGTFGRTGAFSLYPTKNLGALGDGGIVITQDSQLASELAVIREYGWKERYISIVPGINSRLDPIQAAILRVKLRYLDGENEKRQQIAAIYTQQLENLGFTLPVVRSGCTHVYHQYTIRLQERDMLQKYLREQGIAAQVLYPVPIHLQPAYQGRVPLITSLEKTEQAASEILSLPMYPELDLETVHSICHHIRAWAARTGSR